MSIFGNKRNLVIIVIAAVVVLAGGVAAFVLLQPPEPAAVVVPEEEELPAVESDVVEAPEVDPTWPLTGMPLADTSLASNRPLSVKIENSWEARPQLGIARADVVYETLTEGGITRFNCLYQSDIPSEVGPVRSARNSDVTLVPQYQGLLLSSGGNDWALGQLKAAGVDMLREGAVGSLYYRVDYRTAPHNLYLSLQAVYAAAEADGYAIRTDTPPTLEFRMAGERLENSTAKPASMITIPFSDQYIASWQWDETTGVYARTMDEPTTDAETGNQVAVENLVVMWATYTPDPVGGTTLEVNLNGSGRAMVFTGGQWVEGTWETTGATPPRFKDSDGNTILLTPGQSWFSVVQEGTGITAG